MKTLSEIYQELMKEYPSICKNDFLDYCYVYKDGKRYKCTSYSEARKISDHFSNIQCFYDEKRYENELKKYEPILIRAEQEIKRLIKERLGVVSNDKLDDILFELAFELGEKYFNAICNSFDILVYEDDKDYLFTLVDDYYKMVTKHLPKDKLMFKD